MLNRRSSQASAGANGAPRKILAWIGGLLIGIVSAFLLVLLMLPPIDASVDPRSMRGIIHALTGAGLALVAGLLTAFLPGSLSRIAVGTTVSLFVALGFTVIADSPEPFEAMVLAFVMAPACALGGVFAERSRRHSRNVASSTGR